ncbi:MAG TPA: tRNA (adenosine(37)-N6)-threonylcarbamoyltransferase complex dimerization subunit type 1 TsaB [Pyrinomonadaceae bacterium]|jgi:tRNA threonylcarbamoyladenosine biosynthesis protein TsaB|nr:tRNA (adenosine(37)-N6)-threonylcarbamoyltransferase complex dimerization subunit type 1 TsaB [Pyrinomonadaceae bacterium]
MSEGTLILSVDTATTGGGVCVLRSDDVLASIDGESALSHSNTLLRDIQAVLSDAGVSLNQIDLFAVASGPGSFTGLRIGIATIKALAATLNKPCLGIPTLQAIARSGGASKSTVSLVPAGRGELFAQRFSVTAAGAVNELDLPSHIPPAVVFKKYSELGEGVWAGIGAQVHKETILKIASDRGPAFDESSAARHRWRVPEPVENLAIEVARLARDRYARGEAESADQLHALYVRPSDPELKHAGI